MARHPGCTTSLPERCQRHLVPALLRDCPAAALPLSRALSITPPGSGGGRASRHLASSWAFVGTGTGKELDSHCGSGESVVTLNRTLTPPGAGSPGCCVPEHKDGLALVTSDQSRVQLLP